MLYHTIFQAFKTKNNLCKSMYNPPTKLKLPSVLTIPYLLFYTPNTNKYTKIIINIKLKSLP